MERNRAFRIFLFTMSDTAALAQNPRRREPAGGIHGESVRSKVKTEVLALVQTRTARATPQMHAGGARGEPAQPDDELDETKKLLKLARWAEYLSSEEEEAVETLRSSLESEEQLISGFSSDTTLARYLMARKWNVKDALKLYHGMGKSLARASTPLSQFPMPRGEKRNISSAAMDLSF